MICFRNLFVACCFSFCLWRPKYASHVPAWAYLWIHQTYRHECFLCHTKCLKKTNLTDRYTFKSVPFILKLHYVTFFFKFLLWWDVLYLCIAVCWTTNKTMFYTRHIQFYFLTAKRAKLHSVALIYGLIFNPIGNIPNQDTRTSQNLCYLTQRHSLFTL